jgi:hypothetical protein
MAVWHTASVGPGNEANWPSCPKSVQSTKRCANVQYPRLLPVPILVSLPAFLFESPLGAVTANSS